jgi:regulatory protein
VTPRVTALVAGRSDRVRVELDGRAWRTLPAAVVARAGLLVGTALDRPRARELRRELRRAEALELAARALQRHDRSSAEVAARLERGGVTAEQRARTVDKLQRAGYLDDARFAAGRAAALAARDYGDAAIAHDLEGRGVEPEQIVAALATLDDETGRAVAIAARLGASPKTGRRLAARGFSPDAIESALVDLGEAL